MKREELRGRLSDLAQEASDGGLSMADIYAEIVILAKEVEMRWVFAVSADRMEEVRKGG